MSLAIKKQILKEVRGCGLGGAVDDEAMDRIVEFLKQQGAADQLLPLLEQCQRDRPPGGEVTRAVVDSAISRLQGRGQGAEPVCVVGAYAIPKVTYDPVGRKMFHDARARSIFADISAKHKMYLDRLQLIAQYMRRHKNFQQHHQVLAFAARGNDSAQLTDIQSLRGMVGEVRYVMGCLSAGEGSQGLLLEDASGVVPLDVAAAECGAGFFTENCVVICAGRLAHDGVFHASVLAMPPVEPWANMSDACKRLNFFGGPALGPDERTALAEQEAGGGHVEDRIVVAANVWLDRPETLDRLGRLFSGFQDVAVVPPLFVLMGNFHSAAPTVAGGQHRPAAGAGVDPYEVRDGFAALARLIDQFPRIKSNSRFVFVPGPGDPTPSDALPQPPLTPFFTRDILAVSPTAQFTTNPCRIRYLTKEIVVFRYDILKRLRRRCLVPVRGGEPTTPQAMWQHLTLTLLQQAHLCPLPLLAQPVAWDYDAALRLYPHPHALIMGDASPQALHTHEQCAVFTPGSFSDGFFAAYVPCQEVVELSELPRGGEEPTAWSPEASEAAEDESGPGSHSPAEAAAMVADEGDPAPSGPAARGVAARRRAAKPGSSVDTGTGGGEDDAAMDIDQRGAAGGAEVAPHQQPSQDEGEGWPEPEAGAGLLLEDGEEAAGALREVEEEEDVLRILRRPALLVSPPGGAARPGSAGTRGDSEAGSPAVRRAQSDDEDAISEIE